MGSRVRVPSRPLLNFKNPCNSIDYRGFLVLVGHIVGDINYHLKSKSLIVYETIIKHLPYEKENLSQVWYIFIGMYVILRLIFFEKNRD